MSDDLQEMAKKALSRLIKGDVERAIERASRPKPPPPPPPAWKAVVAEEAPKKSEDALDKRAFRKGGFSKAEKRAYAQQKFAEELVQPPKNPPPAWLNDPNLLPKKPPTRAE